MKSKNIGHKILLLSASMIIGLLLGGYPHYSGALSSDSVYSLLPTMLPNLLGGGYSMLGAVFVFVSALHFEQIKRILNWKILRYFGSISYMIYALHFIVLGSFSSYLYLFLFDRGWHHHSASIITLLVSLPIIFVLAYVGTKLVDEKALYLASKIGRLAQANMINFQNRNK